MVQVLRDGEEIFYGEVREVEENINKTKSVYCVSELAFLFDSIQPQMRYQNVTPEEFFISLINKHNSQVEEKKRFVVGIVTVTDPNNSLYRYTNYEDTLTAIREKLCNKLDGHLRVRKEKEVRFIDLVRLEDYGITSKQPIQFGVNMLEYAKNSNAFSLATAVVPLGAMLEEQIVEGLDAYVTIESVNEGRNYVHSEEAVKQFGWCKVTVKWEDVTEPSNLKRKAEEWLAGNQFESLSLELTAVDLSMLNSNIDTYNVGDMIQAIAEPFGMNTWFPLQEKKTYLQDITKNSVILSNTVRKSYTAQVAKANKAMEDAIPQESTLISRAKANATQLITTATNGNIFLVNDEDGNPKELLIMDTKDIETAQKVWRWNVNGLGFSSDGYDGEYGLAMTMDGTIVADRITTGTMHADRIRGGRLTVGGFDNLNGVIDILNKDGENVGVIDNNGIALYSRTSGIQIILSPLIGFVQRDADGNEFYGLIYDEVVGGLPQYSQIIKETEYTGVDSDSINKEVIASKEEEYWIAEPVEPYFPGTKGTKIYKKYRYYYTHNLAYWSPVSNCPSGYTSITIELPNSFKGKLWVVRVQIDSIDTSIIENYSRYDNFMYGELPNCYEGYETTSNNWVLYSDSVSAILTTEDYEAKDRLINMEKTNKTKYIAIPNPSSGNRVIANSVFEKLTIDDVDIDFNYEYDEELGTVTVNAKAVTKKEGYCVNELVKFRVYVVC